MAKCVYCVMGYIRNAVWILIPLLHIAIHRNDNISVNLYTQ